VGQDAGVQELSGKVAVVTGAGSGIGRALALRFAAEGMRVAVADLDAPAGEETVRLVEEDGGEARSWVVDVRDASAVQSFADEVFDLWGQVDLLCNNAGVFVGGHMWAQSLEQIHFVMDVNVWGIIHGIHAFVPRMIEQDTEGHIVNTASVAGLFGTPFAGPYTVSKFAAFAATECLAGDLIAAGTKLRASALCPGIIHTNIATTAQSRPDREGRSVAADEGFVNDLLVDMVETGLEPAHVADRVVDAVRAERFLVLTHDHHAESIRTRAEELVDRRLPEVVDFT
jgi:NAD(P)-dependent dehydrogenase (short-subunit alcohol dehydrogenase family)